jgi:hypothetical protein
MHPAQTLTLDGLRAAWFHQIVSVTVAGYGALADNIRLTNRIRGAWGREMMRTASPQSLAGKPCPWEPPCTLDVFFREQFRLGKHGLPKPFVLALDRHGHDLIVNLTLFGFACDWLPAARDALVAALAERVEWPSRPANLIGGKAPQLSCDVLTVSEMPQPPVSGLVEIEFLTPMDAEGDDPLERPASVIGRLARRIDGLARWNDSLIDADWPLLSGIWTNLEYHIGDLRRVHGERGSRRQNRLIPVDAISGRLILEGELAPLLSLIVLGQTCHVGRGAVSGMGRFRIGSTDQVPPI